MRKGEPQGVIKARGFITEIWLYIFVGVWIRVNTSLFFPLVGATPAVRRADHWEGKTRKLVRDRKYLYPQSQAETYGQASTSLLLVPQVWGSCSSPNSWSWSKSQTKGGALIQVGRQMLLLPRELHTLAGGSRNLQEETGGCRVTEAWPRST